MPLTLEDLRILCERYVPHASRHDGSFTLKHETWWHAHELGHLLTVEPCRLGARLFGLDVRMNHTDEEEHEARCRELAAMHVSRRLLRAAGRSDLARREFEETDTMTRYWDDRGRVRRILRKFNVLRLPWARDALESKLRQHVRPQGSRGLHIPPCLDGEVASIHPGDAGRVRSTEPNSGPQSSEPSG